MIPTIKHLYPNATIVEFGYKTYYFSYETCVAIRDQNTRFRRNQNYSRTTTKHMGLMGVKDWPQVDDNTFTEYDA